MLNVTVDLENQLIKIEEREMKCTPGGCAPTGKVRCLGEYTVHGAETLIKDIRKCITKIKKANKKFDITTVSMLPPSILQRGLF